LVLPIISIRGFLCGFSAGSFSFVPFGFFFLLPNEENEREPAEKDFGFYHRSLAKFQHSLAE